MTVALSTGFADDLAIPSFLDRTAIPFHPLANIFPLMDGDEFEELVADIRNHGQREPVILFEGQILDGRNRYRACHEAGVDCRMETYSGGDPVGFVISLNLRRRHLDASQRAMVATRLATLRRGRPAEEKQANLPISPKQPEAAKLLNVSERSVKTARTVLEHGSPALVREVEQGNVSLSAAAEVAKLPVEQQGDIVERGPEAIAEAAKKVRETVTSVLKAGLGRKSTSNKNPDFKPETREQQLVRTITGCCQPIIEALRPLTTLQRRHCIIRGLEGSPVREQRIAGIATCRDLLNEVLEILDVE